MRNKALYTGLFIAVFILGLTTALQAADILQHPTDQRGVEGVSVEFTVNVEGQATYQWLKNGENILDATEATYTLDAITVEESETWFQCRVTGDDGESITSLEAQLIVYQKGDYDWDGDIDNDDIYHLRRNLGKYVEWYYYRHDWHGGNCNGEQLLELTEFDWDGNMRIDYHDIHILEQNCTTPNCEIIETRPPVIIMQPSSKELEEGDSGLFYMRAMGPDLHYQWQKDGVDIPGANSRKLWVRDVPPEDDGSRFQCVVTNSEGEAISREAVLTVYKRSGRYWGHHWKEYWRDHWDTSNDNTDDNDTSALQIIRQPLNRSVVENKSVLFKFMVEGRKKTFQWLKNGQEIEGATQKNLHIPHATLMDNGAHFQCRVTSGQESILSDEVTLVVYQQGDFDWDRDIDEDDIRVVKALLYKHPWRNKEANLTGHRIISLHDLRYLIKLCTCPECQEPQPAEITNEPEDVTVIENSPASFTVVATGIRLTYQWQVDGVDIPGAIAANYTLASPQLLDHGKLYSCLITNAAGEVSTRAALLQVDMDVPPNDVQAMGLTAAWQQDKAAISWQQAQGMRYQLHRGSTADDMQLIVETDDSTYLDASAAYFFGWYYGVATIKEYFHPVSNKVYQAVGPLPQPVLLQAQPSPTVLLTNVPMHDDGSYSTYFIAGTTYNGSYRNMDSPVALTVSGSGTITTSGTGGTFSFTPPTAGLWDITAVETNGYRSAKAQLELKNDVTAPRLILFSGSAMATSTASISLTGEAIEEESGLHSIHVESDRYTTPFGGFFSGNGTFQITVPVKDGVNHLTVVVQDKSGNTSRASVTVTATTPALPQLSITSPTNGSTVQTDTINVSGTVRSSLEPEKIRLLFGNQVYFPEGSGGNYHFSFDNVKLHTGSNAIKVTAETPYGNVSAQSLVLLEEPELTEEPGPPSVQIFSARPDSFIIPEQFQVSGIATGSVDIIRVAINGQPVTLTGSGTTVSFEALLDFAGQQELDIILVATDSNGKSTRLEYTVYHDDGPPILELANGSLQDAPQINSVLQTPYTLEGTVHDTNLAGFSINDQSFGLLPAGQNQYRFTVALQLVKGQESLFTLKAWDRGGNTTSKGIALRLDSGLDIEIISPRDGEEIRTETDTVTLDIALKSPGLADTDQVTVTVDGTDVHALNRNGINVYGLVELPLAAGQHGLTVAITAADGSPLATTSVHFEVIDIRLIPLELERQEPANNSTGVQNNGFLAFYFNKPLAPALLQIEVLETYHGMDYAKAPAGADLTSQSKTEMIEIHRDREAVAGGISHFPTKTMVAFYPERNFAFGATVYVTLTYDGQELASTTFGIKPLPTFIQGFISDQFGDPIEGVTLSIPELQRSTVSDKEGSYSFGFGDSADETIPQGRYRMFANPNLANRSFGSMEFFATVASGNLNEIGVNTVPVLSREEPFRNISSGTTQAILAAGELTLDLTNATLEFAGDSNSGNVHAQFLAVNEQPYGFIKAAAPQWVFNLNPNGIGVSGHVGVKIKMPAMVGSYEYVKYIGDRVVLVGLDPRALQMVPVGIGRVDTDTNMIVSEGTTSFKRLDIIGYGLVDPEKQSILEEFSNGEIGLNELINRLEN